jgi:Bacterial membrane protein YfhO
LPNAWPPVHACGWWPLSVPLGLALYAGHPESYAVMVLLVYAYLGFRLIQERRTSRAYPVRHRLSFVVGGSAVAALIGLFSLVALLDVTDNSLSLSRVHTHATLPQLFAGLTLPELWGRSDKLVLRTGSIDNFSLFFNGRIYIGVLPFLLAVIGFVRRPSARQWFFAAAGLLAVVAALGDPARAVLSHIPGVKLIGAGAYLWAIDLAATVLAAYGAQRLLSGDSTFRRRGLIVVAILSIGAIGAAFAAQPHLLGHLGSALRNIPTMRSEEASVDAVAGGALLRFLLLAGATCVVLLAAYRSGVRRWVVPALIAIVIVDLGLIDRHWWPMVPQKLVAPPATTALVRAQQSGSQWRVAGVGNALLPNLAQRYGVADARVLDLPVMTRYSALFRALGGAVFEGYGTTSIARVGPQQEKLLDLLAARWVLARNQPSGRVCPSCRPVGVAGLSENRKAIPRASLAYSSQPAANSNAALTEVVGSSASTLRNRPVIEGAVELRGAGRPTPVAIRRSTDTQVELTARAHVTGWLVVSDVFYPGWQATVDGRPARIRLANVAFRAVPIPPGTHRVVFKYKPGRIVASAWISGLSLVATLIALCVATVALKRRQESIQRV